MIIQHRSVCRPCYATHVKHRRSSSYTSSSSSSSSSDSSSFSSSPFSSSSSSSSGDECVRLAALSSSHSSRAAAALIDTPRRTISYTAHKYHLTLRSRKRCPRLCDYTYSNYYYSACIIFTLNTYTGHSLMRSILM